MLLSFIAFGLIYAWLLVHRFRLEQLEERLETEGLEQALAARRAEGGADVGLAAGRPGRLRPSAGRPADEPDGLRLLGYGVSFGILAAYSLRAIRRGRRLSRSCRRGADVALTDGPAGSDDPIGPWPCSRRCGPAAGLGSRRRQLIAVWR